MLQSNNPDWTIGKERAEVLIEGLEAGETEEYTVVLSWIPSTTNFGTKQNIAELVEITNEYDAEETTIADNKESADMIITISTGVETYIVIAGSVLAVLTIAGIVIKRKMTK